MACQVAFTGPNWVHLNKKVHRSMRNGVWNVRLSGDGCSGECHNGEGICLGGYGKGGAKRVSTPFSTSAWAFAASLAFMGCNNSSNAFFATVYPSSRPKFIPLSTPSSNFSSIFLSKLRSNDLLPFS